MGGENRSTREKPLGAEEKTNKQTQPTYGVDARTRTPATLLEGECSHHCATLATPRLEPANIIR